MQLTPNSELRTPNTKRRGVVLVSVLVVVVLLTLAAYQFSELMMAEYRAMDSYTRTAQAKAAADSGVHYVAALLNDPDSMANVLYNNPWENPTAFQDILVNENDRRRTRFSVLTLRDLDDPLLTSQAYRFGVTDEASKLNLGYLLTLAKTDPVRQQMLMMLPNMTQDVANSILDWLDNSSSIPRTDGAKDEYYPTLSPPYHVRSGAPDSMEEMLLVKGITPVLWYGNDRNRNGVIDPDEDPGDGTVAQGWDQFLTIYSREPNTTAAGVPRIYVNDTNLANLQTYLQTAVGNSLAQFLIGYRLYGSSGTATTNARGNTSTTFKPLAGTSSTSVQTQIANDIAANKRPASSISSFFALATAQVSVPVKDSTGKTTNTALPNPLADPTQQATLLATLFDQVTTKQASDLTPRINVNTASSIVLSMLPGLQETDVQTIISTRPQVSSTDPPDPVFSTPAWLLTNANLSLQKLQAIEGFITARSQVYRFQVLGYFDGPGPTARVEAVVDTNNGRPRIVYYRDLAEMGKGFTLPKNNTP